MKAKEITREVFKELRTLDCLCRMNFGSSMDKACKALGAMRDKRRLRGVVYWLRGDETRYKRTGALEIRYFTTSQESATALAMLIAERLNEYGAIYHWNGSPAKTITVYDNQEAKQNDLRESRTISV